MCWDVFRLSSLTPCLAASLLPFLSQLTAASAPHPCAAPSPARRPGRVSLPVTPLNPVLEVFTRVFLRFRSSQNVDKTQLVRSTAASDGTGGRTLTHHGRWTW